MAYRVLLVGKAGHQYNLNFASWLKKTCPTIEISFLNVSGSYSHDEYKGVYDVVHCPKDIAKVWRKISFLEKFPSCSTILSRI